MTRGREYKRRSQLARDKTKSQKRRGAFFGLKWRWLLIFSVFLYALYYVVLLDIRVRSQFEDKRWALPARVYASPLELYPGMQVSKRSLAEELDALGYQKKQRVNEPGDYRYRGNNFYLMTRAFSFWDSSEPSRTVRVRLNGGKSIARISDLHSKESLRLLRLDPRLIGKIYPTHNEDRILVQLPEVPLLLIKALTAVEDRSFFEHNGISLRGIARAALENARAMSVVQGGSTITQQLIKNIFLTRKRSLKRKINEIIMAILLEWHYNKEQILEAYLNEVYLGQDGDHGIHGAGMGAWFYFGRPLAQLKLPEMALLVGLIRAPMEYNPRTKPEKAMKRRNLVLQLMFEQGMITQAEMQETKASPLGASKKAPANTSPYPTFLDLVRRQLRRDYREEDLRSKGLQIFTTLDPFTQKKAERALTKRIRRLERENRKRKLEGALIVTNSENGEVLALVGGRRPRYDGFNRALNALRPIGSLVKPAVYLAALEEPRRYSLVSTLEDTPVQWEDKFTGEIWTPRNYGGKAHGKVPLHKALAYSYNLATVQLGFRLGLNRVRKALRRMGVDRNFKVYPSMLLGGMSLTPLEVTQMYQTLASGGFRTPLRAIRSVLKHDGKPAERYALSVEQTFDAAPVFVLNYALREAIRKGTGRKVAEEMLPPSWALAGKTGTTNNFRDSWFAGFGADLLAVVWLGRDDNKPIGLSGGDGAMRVWGDFMRIVHPDPLSSESPNRVRWRWVNSPSGRVKMPFVTGNSNTTLMARNRFELPEKTSRSDSVSQ
ncbi:MAG: penicillin-binding protein 1B [Gammaproteobacteria bacterium]|nr:penicillin-binding protein 1B [Gammaproteobacteria bacterium]